MRQGLTPIFLLPVLKYPIWGGHRLAEKYKKSPLGSENIGESWELCVRESESCTVSGGKYSHMTLRELLDNFPELMGSDCADKRFPLLIKFIDAESDLSVQIHPDDTVAAELGGDGGKTEMWYIIEADNDASVLAGIKDSFSDEEFFDVIRRGEDPTYMLVKHKVCAGDVIFIPAGTPHAIGAGILIAEIQQNSDTTYRVYDYGRGRQLHTEEAVRAYRRLSSNEIEAIRFTKGNAKGILAACEYFTVRLLVVREEEKFSVREDRFASLLAIDGEATFTAGGADYHISAGMSLFLPAELGECAVRGELVAIITE